MSHSLALLGDIFQKWTLRLETSVRAVVNVKKQHYTSLDAPTKDDEKCSTSPLLTCSVGLREIAATLTSDTLSTLTSTIEDVHQ